MTKLKHNLKKTAVITGASEGIGAALVHELLHNNYKVVAISRNLKKLSKLKSLNSKYKNDLKIFSADVTNSSQLLSIAKNIKSPDLLILNAGIYEPVSIEKFSVETVSRIMMVLPKIRIESTATIATKVKVASSPNRVVAIGKT